VGSYTPVTTKTILYGTIKFIECKETNPDKVCLTPFLIPVTINNRMLQIFNSGGGG